MASSPSSERATASAIEPTPKTHAAVSTSRSLFRYAPALILVLIAVTDAMRYADTDLWGHIRFGQAMLSQRSLVLHDPYSYSAPGHVWRNHEWLCEVIMALVYNAAGVIGLKLMKFGASAAVIMLLALIEGESGASPSLQLGVLTVASVALAPQMQFRPQLFTFMLLAALMWILMRDNLGRRSFVWLAIPILALWANLHGGFIMGVAVLGTYTGVSILRGFVRRRGIRKGARLLLMAVLATLATLITPYGIDAWYAVLHALSNPVTRLAVSDWQPLHYAMLEVWRTDPGALVYYLCVLGLMGALAYVAIRSRSMDDAPLLAVAVLMAVSAVASARNMALFVIAAVGPLAAELGVLGRTGRGDSTRDDRGEPSALNPVFAVAIAIILSVYTGLFSERLECQIPTPSGVVAFMQQHGLHGNLLCDFNWGEYLIWHMEPGSRVFIDGRYDTVYPKKVISDFLKFYFDQRGAEAVLKDYPHDFVIVPPESGGYKVASQSSGWKLIYKDSVAALFARTALAAAISGVPLRGSKPSDLFP